MDGPVNSPTLTMAKRRSRLALVVVAFVAIVAFIFTPAILEWRNPSNRVVCANTLKSIMAAWKLHAPESLPPGVSWTEWLVQNGHVPRNETICPASGLDVSNYILVTYSPEHLVDNATIIAYEPKSNHGGKGGNFVYADGHGMFVRVPEYDELVRTVEQHEP